MMETNINCPSCGHSFAVSEALGAQLRGEIEAQVRGDHDVRMRRAVAEAQNRTRERTDQEIKLLQEQLAAQQAKVREAQAEELALRREKALLEERQREMDLEVARKVDAGKQGLEQAIRKSVGEEQALKVKEKEKQIDDLKKLLDEAKRKSEQGSQETQGEVLELDIHAMLERRFPHDVVTPVSKGVRGGDLIQEVRDGALRPCGSIVWETKNTRHWQPAWLDKLKEDQRAAGANLAVLVSVALPGEFAEFGQIDGVWVASLRTWPALALALREQLIQVAFAHAASEGKNEKMELMYRYLAGDQFCGRVHGIVEAFTEMHQQLHRERRAMERLWKERAKQIERVVTNTMGLYGEMRGIVGASLPDIPALTLEGALLGENGEN